ncbi:MAG TPA: ATP-binding protein, partial [Acetobacteraceae bacterium]|nr:ATP-binding protein [Acetobacteraceae bacterium]
QDVTDIRRAQAALAESEARLRTLANMMPEVIWTARPDGLVDWYNDRWYDYTGLKRNARGDESWMPVVHPDDLDACRDAWQRAVAAGTRFDIEYRLRRHDGAYRWHLGRAVPQCDEGSRILCWFGACIDIGDQKRAEELLLHNRAELERRVEERTRALERTQTQLAQSQRMEALGQLAGGIAHDFNNVLQAVETSASLIERHAADPGEVRRLAGTITSAAERGATVTRRLLAFSRRGALRAEPVDPRTLLTSMREMLAHALGGGVGICLDAGEGLPALLADKGQLETVLVNLATNARDAMAGNGVLSLSAVTETVTQSAPPFHPPALRAGQYIRLSVTDSGAGMDAATLARASEPFFTTKQPGKGTGLGLAMARGFAEQSGGALQIESTPGHGTTVRLWLPLVNPLVAAPTAESGEAATGATPASGHRLMLVDDDEDVLDALVGHMTALGYVVRPVQSAVEALARLDAGEKVDLIVSDLSMPEMDGMTLIGEAQRRQPALPAVLLTGFATDAAEIAARQLPGTVALLHKPIRGRVLAGHVADLLRRRPVAP